MLHLRRYAAAGWLVAGLAAGLLMASFLPHAPLHAVATERLDNFTIATGAVDEDVEAIYFLDVLTGTLKVAVVSNQKPGFQAKGEVNLNADLQKAVMALNVRMPSGGTAARPAIQVPTAPNYAMVTGYADLRRGSSGRARPSLALVYVAETSTGIVMAYVLHWQQHLHAGDQPYVAPLSLWAFDQFTTALVRSP